jgi:hypothetical protein
VRSFLKRYMDGEHEQVWAELTALGDQVREESYYDDALAVAHETMRRVRYNIEALIPRLRQLGYDFGYGWAIDRGVMSPEEAQEMERHEPVLSLPAWDVGRSIEELERRAGTLPFSLRAFYEIVGGVTFIGSHPDGGSQRLDPIEVESAQVVLELDDWMQWSNDKQQDGSCELLIAPDEYHKYRYSGGGSYAIPLLAPSADAPLRYEWHNTTFVNYLRICFRWGGLPGLERAETRPEHELAVLREGLLSI